MAIRRAISTDLPRINELTVQMHQELARQWGLKLSAKELEEEKLTRQQLERVLVAEVGGRVAGYASRSRPKKGEWYGRYQELEHLVVDRQFRRQAC